MTPTSPRLRPAVAAILLFCTSLAAASGPGRPLTIDDLLALKQVSDPRISPDGQWIAYVVEHVDAEKDEAVTTMIAHLRRRKVPSTAFG